MNFGLHALLTSCLALLILPVFFFCPGYLAGWVSGVMEFRHRSLVEQLLWACALSLPFSLLLAAHPGLGLSPTLTSVIFAGCAVASLALLAHQLRTTRVRLHRDRHAKIAAAVALCIAPYVLLSTLPVAWHGRIYESTIWQDWTVRLQLVNAAIRGGNHPGNPMFAVDGQPAPLRYYYFWYVLCARMHDFVPVNARALLAASCVGAGISLLAFLLLSIKYLGASEVPLRRRCTGALIAASILGLDILVLGLTLLHRRFYPDVQFWLDDRSPSWLSMIVWAPHHVAGLVCCGTATLLFVHAAGLPWRRRCAHALVAAVCFAASVGTSTFITLLIASACLFLVLDALLRREWDVIGTVALATIVAGLLIAPFLRQLVSSTAPAAARGPAPAVQAHLLSVSPRYSAQAAAMIWRLMQDPHAPPKALPGPMDPTYHRVHWEMRLFRPPFILGLFVLDFGFFLLVLLAQARRDLLSATPMPRLARCLWLIFAGLAVPGFLLSSAGLQANNDLGRHAGFCMRYVLTLWAAPWIAEFLAQRPRRAGPESASLPLKPLTKWAVAFAVLGMAGQIAQILVVRTRFALTDANLLPRYVVEERIPRIAFRYGQIQQAMAAADAITPSLGIVQSNPHGWLHNVFMLYSDRQMVASDDGCNTPFGGDPRACAPEALALIQLFGGKGRHYQGEPTAFRDHAIPFDPALVTSDSLYQVCSTLKIDTLVASYLDPAWWDKNSWIWQVQPVFANSTARVFRCVRPVPVPPSSAHA